MRRFSARSHAVTLSEINITPLLDLAFVLLIIFIITTPRVEQTISLNLPQGGNSKSKVRPQDILNIEASTAGDYLVAGRKVPNEAELERQIVAAYRANNNIVIRLRVDRESKLRLATTVFDICERHGITRFSFASEARTSRSPR
jgi:biopolymer transport protein ExbD